MNKPPRKLSALIDLAIADSRRLDPAVYRPNATWFHDPGAENDKCEVCLAGAVIAGTLHADPGTPCWPEDYDPEWRQALHALDEVRQGCFISAAQLIEQTLTTEQVANLRDMPRLSEQSFLGLTQFNLFLDDLESRVPKLKALGL